MVDLQPWPEMKTGVSLFGGQERSFLRERALEIFCSSWDQDRCLKQMKKRAGEFFEKFLGQRSSGLGEISGENPLGERDLANPQGKEGSQGHVLVFKERGSSEISAMGEGIRFDPFFNSIDGVLITHLEVEDLVEESGGRPVYFFSRVVLPSIIQSYTTQRVLWSSVISTMASPSKLQEVALGKRVEGEKEKGTLEGGGTSRLAGLRSLAAVLGGGGALISAPPPMMGKGRTTACRLHGEAQPLIIDMDAAQKAEDHCGGALYGGMAATRRGHHPGGGQRRREVHPQLLH